MKQFYCSKTGETLLLSTSGEESPDVEALTRILKETSYPTMRRALENLLKEDKKRFIQVHQCVNGRIQNFIKGERSSKKDEHWGLS